MAIPSGTKLGPYEVVALIGAGGMGEVYEARDTKLERNVAIKVLRDAFAQDADRLSRFQREAKMLAALNHPNIATIYGLEQSSGTSYLVMELVLGETLAERVQRDRVVPVEEALAIAKQIAEAVEAAHEKGIIHRDLKPPNVKLTPEGKVKVLDFGLAKAFASDGGLDLSNAPTLTAMGTEEGRILGTPAYMSPEQARGKSVDKRTDVWAFGCVLYILLTGRQAFTGDTLSDMIVSILEREPDWQALPASTPAKIRDLLRRCLQKDPQRRLRDLGDARIEIEEALLPPATAEARTKRDTDSGRVAVRSMASVTSSNPWWRSRTALWIAVVALLVLLAAAGLIYRPAEHGETIDSIAVLPFVNVSGDQNTEYLSDGITESLINNLSQLPNLKIKSRDSVFHYKGKETDPEEVARQLGVRAIFKGRLTQRGDTLAISAELIDARNDDHLWGQQYNRKLADIFALQDEIAREITNTLRLRLTAQDEKRLAKRYTENVEAYQDYLEGRYQWDKKTEEGFKKGVEYFQQAIAKDPTYALAYAGLADCYTGLAGFGFVPAKEGYPKALEEALKALEIDDKLAEAHASLAFIKSNYDWDWSGAEQEFKRAIELNPGSATAHHFYGLALAYMGGRFEEAIDESKRAVELDPLSLIINADLGHVFYEARKYELAIEQERKTLEMDPNFNPAHHWLGLAYLQKSMDKEGIAEFEKEFPFLGYAYAVAGRRAEAQQVLDKLNELSKQKYVPAVSMARIYVGLGEKDKAFEWLEKAYLDGSIGGGTGIAVDPIFDPLRSDPRFMDILRRMNLQH
jgi:serine/threonine protein kinase/Tfp pilus assembly protein PilF